VIGSRVVVGRYYKRERHVKKRRGQLQNSALVSESKSTWESHAIAETLPQHESGPYDVGAHDWTACSAHSRHSRIRPCGSPPWGPTSLARKPTRIGKEMEVGPMGTDVLPQVVAACHPAGPHPITDVTGVFGSGESRAGILNPFAQI